MSRSNVHLDILMGRDEMIEPADIFGGAYVFVLVMPPLIPFSDEEPVAAIDIHRDMERKFRL
jgi:proteasome maturation protein